MDGTSNSTPEHKTEPTSPPRSGPAIKYKLSCSLCRSRKIKCDRVHPCSHCIRSGVECVFPTRKRMQRPRKSKNSELLNRISRLETIVGNVNISTLKDMDMSDIQGLSELKAQLEANQNPPQSKPSTSDDSTSSGGLQHTAQSEDYQEPVEAAQTPRYIGNDFWVNLVGEVEGLKQALAQTTDSDTEDESTSASPETGTAAKQTFASQGLLAGYPSPESSGGLVHPPKHHVEFLTETFLSNVDPIIKVTHRPTIQKLMSSETSNLSQAQEALRFAIYFAAVTSLPADKCLSHLGQDHMALFYLYQLDVERALAAADYLSCGELECLQAFLLYVACLRVHNESRAAWVLTAMLLRLAQAFGLFHDGDGSQHTPYEAEMRRRIWYQVVVLDIRASEDRGTECMIDPNSYNTKLPLNINDEDFGPESTVAPPERQGPSDVTFSLCTAQSSSIFLWVGHAQSRFSNSVPLQTEEEIISKAQALEQMFITNQDKTHFQSTLAAALVRLINLKLWLVMQYPLHTHVGTNHAATPRWPKVSREAILQTAVSVMELHEYKHNSSKEADRFRWWGATYVQWHPLAVALAELCAQTRGPLVERAWKIVDIVFPKWSTVVADSKRGGLWRPIRKLYKKAKQARTVALRDDTATREQVEALQRLELFAGTTMDLNTQLPPQPRPQQQLQPNSGACPDLGDMNMNSVMDFNAPIAPSAGMGDMLMDLEVPVLSPLGFFTDTMTGWPESINFDAPLDSTADPLNWTVWNEFIDDTNADVGSRTGSSDDG